MFVCLSGLLDVVILVTIKKNRQTDRQIKREATLLKIKDSQFYKVLSLLQFYGFDFYFSQHLFPLGVTPHFF